MINGEPKDRITVGVTPKYNVGNVDYQLKLVVGQAPPPLPPPPPPPPPSGHVVNLAVNLQGNGTGTPSLTASLNALVVGGSTNMGYTPTVLQPGKAYTLIVAGSGLTSGEVLFTPPTGFKLWLNGVPVTRLAYGNVPFTQTYDALLLPEGGTFSGPAGTSSSLDGGSLTWEVALGSLRNGNSAGSLMIADHGRGDWTVFTPQALSYNATSPEIRIHRDNGGALRQILANEALIDIFSVDASSYEIRFYPPVAANLTGYQVPTGNPFITYLIAKDGSPTKLRITKTVPGRSEWTTLERTGTYPAFTWNRADWTLAGANPLVRETRVWTANGSGYDETQQILNESGGVVREARHSYPRLSWGIMPSQSVLGGNASDAITHINLYYTDPDQPAKYGQPRYTVTTGGGWTAYDYSSTNDSANGKGIGTVKNTFTPFGNAPTANTDGTLPPANQGVATTYDYGSDAFGDNRRLISSESKVNGVLTASTTITYATTTANGQRLLTATRTDRSSSNESLVSTTTVYDMANVDAGPGQLSQLTDAFFRDQVHATTNSAGVRQAYIRQRGNWNAATQTFTAAADGAASRIGVIQGLAATTTGAAELTSYDGYTLEKVYVVPSQSTLSLTIRDAKARVVRTTTEVYTTSGWSSLDWATFTYNDAGQLLTRANSRGETEALEYTGLLLTKSTDSAGGVTTYTYDAAGRIKTTTRQGFGGQADRTTAFTYDAAGQILLEDTYSTSAGEHITRTRTYDRLGRPTLEQPSGLGATRFNYDPANRRRTATAPDGATTIQESYLDGQPSSLTGTGTVAEFYFYGVEPDGRRWSRRHLAAADSPRWTTNWSDWLGRTVRTEAPPYTGAVNRYSAQQYNARGLLSREEGSGTYPTLYEHDAFGRVTRSASDFNENGTIDLAGPDRIADREMEFAQRDNAWWLDTREYGYLTFNNTRTLVSQSAARLTEFSARVREEAWSEDIEGNRSTVKVEVDPSLRQILRTTTAPGLAAPAVEKVINGLPTNSTAPDGITVTTSYDALGRATKTTHIRGSTTRVTTTNYLTGTTLPQSVIDPSNATVATYTYDPLGRPLAVSDVAGKFVRSAYTLRGELARQWGEATYPVAFEYNGYGERTALRTYQSDVDNQWNAATWPTNPGGGVSTSTWEYAPATGGLLRQVDTEGRATDFTYYFDGKLQKRTLARAIPGTGTRVSATYTYVPKTTQLARVDYNDGTPALVYGDYTRTGSPGTVTDATGSRTFAYNSTLPWRVDSETLPAYFGGRVFTPLYQTATTTAAGTRGSYQLATVKGATWGYRLGTSTTDLEVNYPTANSGRLAGINSTVSGTTTEFNYTYAADTRLVASLTTGSFSQNRIYDAVRDLPTEINSKWNAEIRLSYATTYNALRQPTRRVQAGIRTTADYGEVLTTDFVYDARQQLTAANTYLGTQPALPAAPTAAKLLPGRDFSYGYDAIGNRTRSNSRAGEPARQSDYVVNSLNQYTSRTQSGLDYSGLSVASAKVAVDGKAAQRQGKYYWQQASFTGAADVRPIPIAAALASGTTPDTVNQDNTRYGFFPGSPEVFTHDLDGNLTSDGTWDYTYDAENRLIAQQQKSWTILPLAPKSQRLTYTYDYQGRRVSKAVHEWNGRWVAARETRFLYEGWNLIAEFEISNSQFAIKRSFVWGLDLTSSFTASGGVGALVQVQDHAANKRYLPAYDPNGNVTSLTDATTGATVALYEYSPYGELLRANGSVPKLNPFRFSTKYTDDETNLVYYGHRFYDPRNGRFINRDPINIEGGYNLYAFVKNGPNYRWDYLGLDDSQNTLDRVFVYANPPPNSGLSDYFSSNAGNNDSGGGGDTQTTIIDPQGKTDVVIVVNKDGSGKVYVIPVKGDAVDLKAVKTSTPIGAFNAGGWAHLGFGGSSGIFYSAGTGVGLGNLSYYNFGAVAPNNAGINPSGNGDIGTYLVRQNAAGDWLIAGKTNGVTTQHAFVNGILGTLGRHAELGGIHLQSKFGVGVKEFTLFNNPSKNFIGDGWETMMDKFGFTSDPAKALAGVLQDIQVSGRSVDWIAHSQGGAIFAEAMRYSGGSLSANSVTFNAGANNHWVTNSIAASAGVQVGGYNYSSWDAVPNVIGMNGNPLSMLGSVLAAPLLFTNDYSPHSEPTPGWRKRF